MKELMLKVVANHEKDVVMADYDGSELRWRMSLPSSTIEIMSWGPSEW
jgi:hypothetical protein